MRRKIFMLCGLMLFLAGCAVQPASQTLQPAGTDAAALPPTSTVTPDVIYVTATPNPGETLALPEASQTAILPAEATETPVTDASLNITAIDDLGGGRALVHWSPVGSFPSGYVLVWTDQSERPVFPGDNYNYAGDSNSRSALITLQTGKIYYLRVCRFTGSGCDVYSNLGIFALKLTTPTPYITAASGSSSGGGTGGSGSSSTAVPGTAYNPNGTPVSSTNGITITSMEDAGTGKAKISWTAAGSFSQGFAIVYSPSSTTPYIGGYAYYVVGNSAARSAYVEGTPGTKTYYRVCRYTGSSCVIYSNTYTYTFSGSVPTATPDPATITIYSVAPTATLGQASITWGATGSFLSGYKILISKTNSSPTISSYDQLFAVDTGLTSTTFTGDPGATYYVRMCKTVSGTCGNYSSNVATVAFPADTSTITNVRLAENTAGIVSVSWEASEDAPQGFKIVYSTVNSSPTLADSVSSLLDGALRVGSFTGEASSTYYVRVCRIINQKCSVYSDPQTITLALPQSITISEFRDVSNGTATVLWSTTGLFSEGYRVLISSNNPPLIADAQSVINDGAVHTTMITGTMGLPYWVSICGSSGEVCSVVSTPEQFTFGNIVIDNVVASGTGTAEISWHKVGAEITGYRIFLSSTNHDPYSGSYEFMVSADGTATSATITGNVGVTYYITMCNYRDIDCVFYSTPYEFTY
jgi:hypothetical protein